ncbi:MAG: winged-helix domain-containing protein [Dehalococcoidia bacterium]|nr:winged-helix domain-containing protein [Dehalococcoidia bacterium]
MASVLAIAPDTPPALLGRHLIGEQITVEVTADPRVALRRDTERSYDLLVLAGFSVDEQNELAQQLQQERRWRIVPVLYLVTPGLPGLAVPGSFRPDIDGMVRGTLETPAVQRRIREMAREGVAAAEVVVAGPFELDPIHGRLRSSQMDVPLTEREAEILSLLLARPNKTVTAGEIIERSWGVDPDERYLQILRRHVSNIRRKLEGTQAGRSVRTVRGTGYRFDIRQAS